MSVFTVCRNLVRRASTEHAYLANVLNVFVLDTPAKIAVDKVEKKVLQSYGEIAEESHHIYSWLDLLGKVRGASAFELVEIPKREYDWAELFVAVCANTIDGRVLLCSTKQDYQRTNWRRRRVTLLDRDEAKETLKQELGKVCGGVWVMGDVFAGIQGSTIINKSKVERSFNRVKKEVSEDVAKALVEVAEAVVASGSKGAGVVLDAFNNELAKSKPDKSELQSYWQSLLQLVPGINQMVDVVAKVTKLFVGA